MAELLSSNMLFAVLVLAVGFILLVKGADWFVDGSSVIAKKLRIPSIIIGMTIVAMGTSLPETAVSVSASLAGSNSLAISNVIGSNIFNLMAVIGICAAITPVAVQSYVAKRDFPLSIAAALLLLVLGFIGMSLSTPDGIVFVVLFACFIISMIIIALRSRKNIQTEVNEKLRDMSVFKCILFIVCGAAAIIVGGDFVVDSSSAIASRIGISETLIGLTVVSIGTSLPELVTSVVAAKKNEVDIALGNALGSNIFNILMVLGIAGAISPMAVITNNLIDVCVLIGLSIIVWILAAKRKQLKHTDGIIMVLLYLAYTAYIIIRDM